MLSDQEAWKLAEENIGLGKSLASRYYASRKKHGQILGGVVYDEMLSAANEVLFKAAKHFDPSRGFKFTTYAGTALWRAFTKIERRQRPTIPYGDNHEQPELERGLDQAELDELLADLDERSQAILVAHYWEGLTARETAEYLGTTVGVVKRTIEQSLRQLRRTTEADDLRPTGGPVIKHPRESRPIELPSDHELPAPQKVRATGGQTTASGTIFDQMRHDKRLAAKYRAKRREAEEDARAAEAWYAGVKRDWGSHDA